MISTTLRITILSAFACVLSSSAILDYRLADKLLESHTIEYVLLSAEAEKALGFTLDVNGTQFMNILETINENAKQGKTVCKNDFIFWTAVSHALQMSMAKGKGNYFDDDGEKVFCARAIVKGSKLSICAYPDTFVRLGDFDEENGSCVLNQGEGEKGGFLSHSSRQANGNENENGNEIVVNLQMLDCRSHKKSLCRDYCCEPKDEDAMVFCNEEVQCWSQT